jgi:7-carboxy-7-deazaguanine synthase
MMDDKRFPVVEIFGPTIQGEGALAGRPTHFVRFGGCDFTCLWCDSSHAVLPVEVRKAEKITANEIVARLLKLEGNPEWVTLSGGNPALHNLDYLVNTLQMRGFKVTVETQGSRWAEWFRILDLVTVSPKPPSSGMKNDFLPKFLDLYSRGGDGGSICLKVPVFDDIDLDFARRIHREYPHYPFYLSVVTRMGGLYGDFDGGRIDTKDDILVRYRWLVERVAGDRDLRDVTVFPQLHALIWGHDRGH